VEPDDIGAVPSEVTEAIDRADWLAMILAHSADVITLLALDGTLLYMNRAGEARATRDVVGSRSSDFLEPASRERWEAALRRVVETATPEELEVSAPSGNSWRARLVPVLREGRVAYLMSVGTDVTGERQAESALRRREQQLRLALEASGMGQWWWNVARDEVTWDAGARRIFAFDPHRDDITYSTFLDRVHPEEVERVRAHVAEALKTGTYANLESRIVLPDGSERWALMIGRVLQDAQGEPTDLLGGIVDITQSKANEAVLRRTEKLEAIGQLAGGVAHDFNNLLVAIMGNIELARRVHEDATRDGHLSEALLACSRAADLTRQLLAFGRRQQLHETELDVNDVIDDTMKLLRRLLPTSIRVDVQRSSTRALVRGDRGQLEQVLVNLCVNARDAMQAGGCLSVRVSEREIDARHRDAHPWVSARRHVVVSVHDTGDGIAPEVVHRVFEPFFTTKPQGTGLGLASAYGVVKQHGGLLHVQSELGVGTTFELWLPRAESAEATEPEDAPVSVRGGSETVLVAEDESAVSYVVVRILEGAGYRVIVAEDGARAVELFTSERAHVALALLDSVMPKKGGVEVAKELRELEPRVGIILSSGYSDVLTEAPPGPLFDAVLPKPYEPDQLLVTIRGVLDARARRRAR